ncbi:MAG: uroporphyrinogen decarboxylase family protein, partial [Candidatus Bathyarchaeia archaeon]
SLWNMDEEDVYNPDSLIEQCKRSEVDVDPKIFDVLRYLAKRVGGKFFLSFDADGSWGPIVSNPNLLRHVLVWMYKRPEIVKALIEFNTRYALELGSWAIDEGADAIQMCVDYGNKLGPWFSPEMFRKFVKPALKKQCDAFKLKGAFAVLHSDGNIAPILSDVVEAGINAYQGIDVIASMSLKYVKENYGDKICLVGNVDPRILEFGKREDVTMEVERCLREGGFKGYVLSASANISANTNADNFLYMIEYAKKRGACVD